MSNASIELHWWSPHNVLIEVLRSHSHVSDTRHMFGGLFRARACGLGVSVLQAPFQCQKSAGMFLQVPNSSNTARCYLLRLIEEADEAR